MPRFIAPAMLCLLSGCAGFQSLDAMNGSPATLTTATMTTPTSAPSKNGLDKVYAQYRGTPYRYGGTDANGFDCSGFIKVAYNEAFGMSLPRTTEQLAVNGQPIRRDQLSVGDLVFFRTSAKQLHAGIYTGQGRFIHASTSKGVIESSLDNQYWRQRYFKARRYL
ncbi:C40 family peptidase [Reinekea blandensis]|nr:NlpC/P60 family protein [Reinekea blandensis]